MRAFSLFLCALLAFSACKITKKQKPETVKQQAREFHRKAQPVSYQPTEKKESDLLHTRLEISFDWQQQKANGKARITLSPHFYPANEFTLDAQGFDLHRVAQITGNDTNDLRYTYSNYKLRIKTPKIYSHNEKIDLFIDYTATPNNLAAKGSDAINDAKGLYFINPLHKEKNKPTELWTQGETQSNSAWFPTIDHPNQKHTQEFFITVDEKYVTLSNGELVY